MFKHVCGETNHKFEEFLVEEIPPDFDKTGITKLSGDVSGFIESLTKKKYAIRCKYCGKKVE